MNAASRPSVLPIGPGDVDAVADFLHTQLNPRVPREAWRGLLRPPWGQRGPNSGFQLVSTEGVVGAYAAVYAVRGEAGRETRICNLAAFCVLEPHRAHAVRLLRALVGQEGFAFTDLSPSGNVPRLNEMLGFEYLDTRTRLTANVPRPARGRELITDLAEIDSLLSAGDRGIFRDHRDAAACHHLVVSDGGRHAYLVYRHDRRRGVRAFATPLYVGADRGLLDDAWGVVATYLLRRGLVATLAEPRILGFTPPGPARDLGTARPRMFRGAPGGVDRDYLYSELALVPW